MPKLKARKNSLEKMIIELQYPQNQTIRCYVKEVEKSKRNQNIKIASLRTRRGRFLHPEVVEI